MNEETTVKCIIGAAAIALLTCIAPFAYGASAAEYPSKPVRLLIPSPPGGGTDVQGRLLKTGFDDMWKQPIIVDNRGGASGRIAAAAAAQANPDGHTLFFTYGGVLTTGLPLFRKLPYHPIKDFTPIAMMGHVPGVLLAHPSFPAKTVADIIRMAKAKPGGLTHGTSSIGSSSHLNMELFKQMAGLDMLGVTYQGDGPALIALLGAQVPFAFNNLVAAQPHLQSGKLRPIAVATAQRIPSLPAIPTVAESGLPGYDSLLFYALVGPAGIPDAIVSKINDAVSRTKQMPQVKQQLDRLGVIPIDMTPRELGAFIQRELEKWTKIIEAGKVQPK